MYYEKFFGIFNRLRKSNEIERRKRGRDEVSLHSPRSCSIEQLEPRIALTVNDIVIETGGAIENGWVVLAMDASGDEVYLRATQEIAPTGEVNERVEYADNPSFVSPGSFRHEQAVFQDVLVTNGTQVQYDTLSSGPAELGDRPTFSVPDASDPSVTPGNWSVPSNPGAYHIVPGTMVGLLSVTHAGQTDSIFFAPGALHGVDDDGDEHAVDMVFLNSLSDTPVTSGVLGPFTITTLDDEGEPETESVTIQVTGEIDYFGELRFVFASEDAGDEDEPFTGPDGGSSVNVSYFAPIVPDGPSAVTLASGRDFQLGLQADLPGPDSAVQISSPLVSPETSPITNDVVLAATTVQIDSPVTSNGSFLVTPTSKLLSSLLPVGGSRATVVEEFRTNTDIQAEDIGVSVGDDTRTTVRERGAAIIGPSGSWTSNGNSLSVRAVKADIDIAGKVTAANQSYLFRAVSEEDPYRFQTRDEGLIDATTLDITLDSESEFSGSDTVIHPVVLTTDATSLRISAERDNTPATTDHSSAFDITINATSNLNIDAVVTTGAALRVNGDLDLVMNSSVRTLGDVVLSAAGDISGKAEISTDDGIISIAAADVSLDGSLRVLNPSYDDTQSDISITARDGSVVLRDTLSAANRVVINQEVVQGNNTQIGSGSVDVHEVIASQVFINAEGGVTLRSDVDIADITAGENVSVVESGDGEFQVAAGGATRIVANGIDPADNTPALRAVLENTDELIISAPRGSIEVVTNTANDVILGDRADLRTGGSGRELAAGSVTVRSTQGRMRVYDAPLAGFGEVRARVASNHRLDGTFSFNNPGQTPSTLTAVGPGNINDTVSFDAIFPGLGNGKSLRIRDVVLLRSQQNQAENGLYQITSIGSDTTPWVLTRVAIADETVEFQENSRVAILDGLYANRTFRVASYSNALDSTPLLVFAGNDRSSGEVHVRAATDVRLAGTHAGGVIMGDNPNLVVSGVPIANNDLVLVRFGVIDDTSADGLHASAVTNGIYQATIDDPAASFSPANWLLTRYIPFGAGSAVEEAVVVVDDGIDRTAVTGETYSVIYDGLGIEDLTFAGPETPALALGSFDPRDSVEFIVSTRSGTNSSSGSLGRMLSLVQANVALDFNQENVSQGIVFANVLGGPGENSATIQLQQELPKIERPFTLSATSGRDTTFVLGEGSFPVIIDGSRITSTREGNFVVDGDEVNGFVIGVDASGETRSISPEEAPRSMLEGVRLIGFESGAAIQVDGASNYLLRDITVGVNAVNESQAVKYGVHVKEGSGSAGPITILNNNIYSASVSTGSVVKPLEGAAILVESTGPNEADSVQIVGSELGRSDASNFIGIRVNTDEPGDSDSTQLETRSGVSIGVNPLTSPLSFTTFLNKSTISFSQEQWLQYGKDIFLGQSVSGPGVPLDTEVAFIETGELDSNDNGLLEPVEDINQNKIRDVDLKFITLSKRITSKEENALLVFGDQASDNIRNTVNHNFRGISLASGQARIANTQVESSVLDGIELGMSEDELDGQVAPVLSVTVGDSRADISFSRLVSGMGLSSKQVRFSESLPVFPGMFVTDPEPEVSRIPAGTYVEAVDYDNNIVTLTQDVISSFVADDRLFFQGFNPRIRDEASNAILRNGRYGIVFKDSIEALGDSIIIQGNYVGTEHDSKLEPGNFRSNYFAHNENLSADPKFGYGENLSKQSFYDRSHNFSLEESQFVFGDRENNVNSEGSVPLVKPLAPSDVTAAPGAGRITVQWTPPVVNDNTYDIRGYIIRVEELVPGTTAAWVIKKWELENSADLTRYEIRKFGPENPGVGEEPSQDIRNDNEYRISIAAQLVDKDGMAPESFEEYDDDGEPLGYGLTDFSVQVGAIPTQPTNSPPRRPVTRF